jgi:4-hydroxy-3-methylbut-2-en-1-yl diphosphate synthase IspG/GcpE
MEHGAQGIRINPGNLGGPDKLARVVDCRQACTPFTDPSGCQFRLH